MSEILRSAIISFFVRVTRIAELALDAEDVSPIPHSDALLPRPVPPGVATMGGNSRVSGREGADFRYFSCLGSQVATSGTAINSASTTSSRVMKGNAERTTCPSETWKGATPFIT